ncbi:hypothetical protein Q0812_01070 [Brevundimonas sp. 2R-24]|uniref:Secreted protein n=1 Tax=Peiella sedimenti TaxID=3061083 RepID=A0ABT8SHH1_9CAUL|nr:hypothetical protein [Caulobacteraceae bacterium XZ-24]
MPLRRNSATRIDVRTIVLTVMILMLRLAVPPGYMLSQAPGEAPILTLCTANGVMRTSAEWTPERKRESPAVTWTHSRHCAPPVLAVEPDRPLQLRQPILYPAAFERTPGATPQVLSLGLAAPPPRSHAPPRHPERLISTRNRRFARACAPARGGPKFRSNKG